MEESLRILVLGQEYSLVYFPELSDISSHTEEQQIGCVNLRTNTVYIDGVSSFETVIHELVHIYRIRTGQESVLSVNDLSEYVPDQVATFTDTLIRENGVEVFQTILLWTDKFQPESTGE